MMSHVTIINSLTDFLEFKKKKNIIILYGAEGCDACDDAKHLYYRIAKHYHKHIGFAYVDIDKNYIQITNIPTFIHYHNGEEIDNIFGFQTDMMKSFIKDAILYEE